MQAKLSKSTIDKLALLEKPYEVHDTEVNGFLLRVQPSGVMSYYFAYRTKQGKRNRVQIDKHGNVTPDQARDLARQYAGDVARGIDPQNEKKREIEKANKDKYSTLGKFITYKYEPWRTAEKKDGEEEIARLKRHFENWFPKKLTDINTWLVTNWRNQRLKDDISRKTVNRDIATLKTALSYAIRIGLLEVNPLDQVKPLKIDDRSKVRFLSDDEEKRLRQALDDREALAMSERLSGNEWRKKRGYALFKEYKEDGYIDHIMPLIIVLMNTGCRPSEIMSLEWCNVDLHRKQITIEGKYAKSGRTRHIPLSNEAVETLEKWRKQNELETLVFPSPRTGKVMGKLPRAITRLLKNAKIENFRPYDLRHSYASKLAMSGIDLNTIRELLGHADINTTLIYAHLSQDHKRNAVEQVFNKA